MRILITGASGSGTTTLGKALAVNLVWHHLDGDDYYWLPTQPPYQQARDSAQRLSQIETALAAQPHSVVSGSVMNWGAELEHSFALVVFLYLDTEIRIQRLRIREQCQLGVVDEAFISWAAAYDTGPSEGRSLVKHQAWLAKLRCPVLRLSGDLTVAERLAGVKRAVKPLFNNA